MKNLQLQFFDHASRAYVAAGTTCTDPQELAERARHAHPDSLPKGHKAWRIASTDRALKPKYTRRGLGASRGGTSRTIEQIQCEYVEWAKAKGLKRITYYISDAGKFACAAWHGEKIFIMPDEHFAVTEWTTESVAARPSKHGVTSLIASAHTGA